MKQHYMDKPASAIFVEAGELGTKGTQCITCKAVDFPCWKWKVRRQNPRGWIFYTECAACGHQYKSETGPQSLRKLF